jgi:ComF family protein
MRLPFAAAACGTCLAHPLPLAHCRCAVDYAPPWDGLIQRFKYHAGVDLAALLAQRLASAVAAHEAAQVDLVLPLPLAPRRLAERGYNQAWELARRVARGQRRPASPRVLQRWLETAPQAGLDRAARQRNLQGAFVVALPQAVAGRHVALVDDVLTTGASVGAAALALRAAGAASVCAWVLARTP